MTRIEHTWFLELCCAIIVIEHGVVLPKATAQLHPLPKVTQYTLIQPRYYHGRDKREVLTTEQEDENHLNYLMSYEDEDKSYFADLQLNQHLITKGYSVKYQESGKYVDGNNCKPDVELCYLGKLEAYPIRGCLYRHAL